MLGLSPGSGLLDSGRVIDVNGAKSGAGVSSVPGGRSAIVRIPAAPYQPAQAYKQVVTTQAARQKFENLTDAIASITSAGDFVKVELGEVKWFLDMSGTALVLGKIIAIPPGGGEFDLAIITRTKSSGDGFPGNDSFGPGWWTLLGLADLSAGGYKIIACHYDN